jgi:hypothetical protein
MAQMDFFRRPQIAGNNLKRTSFATVRSSLRRKDADGSYSAPYYAGVTVGQTLLVTTQAGSYTVTFNTVVSAGIDYNQAIADINAAITGASAVDLGGVISISSTTAGSTGSISITGGSASIALGFDTTMGSISSFGGEVPSSPEGRLGNPFGTALPTSGENFTNELLTRAFGRISSNQDVLYSDLAKEDAILQKIGTVVGSADGKSVTPGSTVKVFNGYAPSPILTRLSIAEEIAPFILLVDPTTKKPLPNRVVAMVAAPAPVGDPPYLDATTPTDAGKNLFGLNLTKFGPVAITSIKNGMLVKCTGAGTASTVGDVVGITGATNTTQWNHNGTKWAVERIIGADDIVLRPLSKAELTQLGITLTEIHPVVELNHNLSGGQVYGNLTVFTGMYNVGVSLIVRPILGVSQSVEVWAAQPLSLRSAAVGIRARASYPFANIKSTFRGTSDTDVPLISRKYATASTAHLTDWTDEAGTPLTYVDSSGRIVAGPNAATTEGILATGNTTGPGVKGQGGASGQGGLFTPGGGATPVTGNINLPHLAATPSAPVNGDVWTKSTGVFAQINAALKTLAMLETAQTFTVPQTFTASATRAPINLVPATPSTPTDGDLWVTAGGVFGARLNGSTKSVALQDTVFTRANLPSVGQQISASSSTFSTSSGSFVDVTNLSVTFTTSGRPVLINLQSDGSGNPAGFSVQSTTGANVEMYFRILRDATEISRYDIFSIVTGGGNSQVTVPANAFILDLPSAASHTYKVQVSLVGGNTVFASYLKLVAYEL